MPRRAAVVGAMDAVDLDAAPDAAAHLRVEQDLGNARLVDEDAFLRESTLRRGPTPAAVGRAEQAGRLRPRSEEHTSELQSLMRISYAVFCLKKKQTKPKRVKI